MTEAAIMRAIMLAAKNILNRYRRFMILLACTQTTVRHHAYRHGRYLHVSLIECYMTAWRASKHANNSDAIASVRKDLSKFYA